ncbi:uncharacterized protein EDB93DRAFT_1254573 [Suillus bovinus]|uniref:uncharacterized protein n=1 Tax=Suillus bovinus TaxID=48563 RepID=UPI001B87EF31|nr:uncharacterized protein EDB93DRAFT_1254573 [Suillus bovinus]KAG2134149.1 hypothetical protein EDB93DRAFT_1254573 [Suillus bovinus]
MDNDLLLPVGPEYGDEPRQEPTFEDKGTSGQNINRKRKDCSIQLQTEYIDQLLPRRVRLMRLTAKTLSMFLADTEQSVPSQPQPVVSPLLFAPTEADTSTVSSQPQCVASPPPFTSQEAGLSTPQPVASPPLFIPPEAGPSTVPSKSIVLHPPSAPLNLKLSTVPSQSINALVVALPDISELSYNQANPAYQKIVLSAMKAMKIHSVKTTSISNKADR